VLVDSQLSNEYLGATKACKISTSGYMAVLFISIGSMPFLAPTLDSADLPFTLVITPCFYMHHVEVADQDPASGSL